MTLSLSTAQQTPGPWSVDGEGTKAIVRGADLTIVAVRHRLSGDVHYANARLIAAAPELLAALKALDAYWLESLPGGPDGSRQVMSGLGTIAEDTIAIWKQARAAISKAKGAA